MNLFNLYFSARYVDSHTSGSLNTAKVAVFKALSNKIGRANGWISSRGFNFGPHAKKGNVIVNIGKYKQTLNCIFSK